MRHESTRFSQQVVDDIPGVEQIASAGLGYRSHPSSTGRWILNGHEASTDILFHDHPVPRFVAEKEIRWGKAEESPLIRTRCYQEPQAPTNGACFPDHG